MPPVSSSQHSVYCACPGPIRPRSLVSVALTYAAAPGPATTALPRWLTSKMPTLSRTAVCSLTTPAAYSSGIDQPPNSANFAPSASCRSCKRRAQQIAVVSHGAETYRSATCCVYSCRPVTTYTCARASPAKTRADAVVVGVLSGRGGPTVAPGGEPVAKAYGRKFAPLLAALGVTGKAGEVVKVPDRRRHRLAAAGAGRPRHRRRPRPPYAGRPGSPPGRRPTRPRSRSRCPPTRPSWCAP